MGKSMRVVIDSNRIQSEELFQFLTKSGSNRAVVTDWLMMEAYKGETLNSIYKSLGILTRFPRQTIVLKNTGMCMKIHTGPQMSKRLIWKDQTDAFPDFIREIEAARTGNRLIESSLLWRGETANERMGSLLQQADFFMERHHDLQSVLTPVDISAIRGKGSASEGIISRLTSIAYSIAEGYRQALNIKELETDRKNFTSNFLFRVGVAHLSSGLEWIRTGSQRTIKPEKVRNDYVDSMLSVYGTYFNGLMTMDSKLSLIHSLNRHLLKAMGATLPPAYQH